MLFSKLNMNLRSRQLIAIGGLYLAIGLSLGLFIHPSSQTAKNWIDGVSGLLVGISLVTNCFGWIHARRCRVPATE